MDIAQPMAVFVRAVDEGSLSAAARSLDISPSAISKQIRRLENRLGVRLLNRSTRRVSLTDEGRVFYARCARITADIEETETLALTMSGHVAGTLRVVATVAFGKAHLVPLFPGFMQRYPELDIEVELSDRHVDLVEEGIDVAVRFTEQVADANLAARRLAHNSRVVVAAPAYLEAHGVPRTPAELATHNCLRLSTVRSWNDWAFEDEGGCEVLHVEGNFETNSADAVYHAALAGIGIARLSTYLVSDDVRAGRLVVLLPDYRHEQADILAVYPHRRNLAPRVRAFIDFLVEQLGPVPPWERVA